MTQEIQMQIFRPKPDPTPIEGEWLRKTSSNIGGVRYDVATQTLEVMFTAGTDVYAYLNVPPEVAAALQAAPSIGSYFHAKIKNKYCFKKRKAETAPRTAPGGENDLPPTPAA